MKHFLLFSSCIIFLAGCTTTTVPPAKGENGLYYQGKYVDANPFGYIFVYDENKNYIETIKTDDVSYDGGSLITLKGKDKDGNSVKLVGSGC